MNTCGLKIRFVALTLALVGCSGESAQPPSKDGPVLDLQVRASSVTGSFARAGSLAVFESAFDAPEKGRVHININGQEVDISIDRVSRSMVFDGHNGALFAEDTEALGVLAQQLRDRAAKGNITESEDLLLRAAMYLSEAPAGYTLTRREKTNAQIASTENKVREGMLVSEHRADGTVSIDGVMDAEGKIQPPTDVTGNPGESDQACSYYSGEDGILYFSCTYTTRWIEHDASTHCMSGAYRLCGNGGKCRGECGPGCWGLNIYTYDCGDHDWCLYDHGGSAVSYGGECGDEFGEADDDFMLGWPNC